MSYQHGFSIRTQKISKYYVDHFMSDTYSWELKDDGMYYCKYDVNSEYGCYFALYWNRRHSVKTAVLDALRENKNTNVDNTYDFCYHLYIEDIPVIQEKLFDLIANYESDDYDFDYTEDCGMIGYDIHVLSFIEKYMRENPDVEVVYFGG